MTASARKPACLIDVEGRSITVYAEQWLISLELTESRGDEADQLSMTLDDSEGMFDIPRKGAEIWLCLGWKDGDMVDKGTFIVDEIEHAGTPDTISIRARSANMRQSLRRRSERSWHDSTLGAIVGEAAQRHGLAARVDGALANIQVPHIDQTNESDLHFLTRLARQHDAVCTVKKDCLVFAPINSSRTATGQPIASVTITRSIGDRHRWHSADRGAYSGVRAEWDNVQTGERLGVVEGSDDNAKTLKDIYASEQAAREAARAEHNRIERGAATLELTLALGNAALMPQTAVTVEGFKPQIDGNDWLIKTITHTISDGGFTTRLEMETRVAAAAQRTAAPSEDDESEDWGADE